MKCIKVSGFVFRLALFVAFLALVSIKVTEMLEQKTGISLSKSKKQVEIPTITICIQADQFKKESMRYIPADEVIETTILDIFEQHMEKNGNRFNLTKDHWNQTFYFMSTGEEDFLPCFFLDPPMKFIDYPQRAKVFMFSNQNYHLAYIFLLNSSRLI